MLLSIERRPNGKPPEPARSYKVPSHRYGPVLMPFCWRPFDSSAGHHMRRRSIAFAIALQTLCGRARATQQILDEISIYDEKLPLLTDPLHSIIGHGLFGTCTANYRGYIAFWDIWKDQLRLVKLVLSPCERPWKGVPLDRILPGAVSPYPATWYSGTLLIPLGPYSRFSHTGRSDDQDNYWVFEVVNGKVISAKTTVGRPE